MDIGKADRLCAERHISVVVAAAVILVTGCDFSITNPGPVQDEFLNESSAASAVANGVEFQLSNAMGWISYTGGIISKEIVPSGHNTNTFGVTDEARAGRLAIDETSPHWESAHEARWMALDAARRFQEEFGEGYSSMEEAARVLLYGGFANRLLGENMCKAVLDGGEPQDHSVHFERAEEDFTEALEIAQAAGNQRYEHAALAGRASVRIWLGDWQGAVSDASQVPNDFEFVTRYNDGGEDQYNRLFWAQANSPFRAFSVYSTFYDDYYENMNDPRTPWSTDPENQFGTVGEVPFYVQEKYLTRTSPMVLASGREMQLIRAEQMLRNGNWEDAMQVINGIRQEVGVDPWEANSETEAWSRLKRERGIQLWLEARRLPDRRRWIENNVPGDQEDMSGRDLCFPIALSERETNENIPISP